MNTHIELIHRLSFYDKLTENEKVRLGERLYTRHYKKGEHILHSGMNGCHGLLLLLSGEIRAYILSDEGREVTLFRLHNGETCVFSAVCAISQITFDPFLIAESDCDTLVIGSVDFSELINGNIYVRCFMYELLAERFSSVMKSMQQILFFGFDRRLASFLAGEHDRTGAVQIRMTHDQIARYLGSAREVVARMLKRFGEEGLVEFRRGCVYLKDIPRLRLMAQ